MRVGSTLALGRRVLCRGKRVASDHQDAGCTDGAAPRAQRCCDSQRRRAPSGAALRAQRLKHERSLPAAARREPRQAVETGHRGETRPGCATLVVQKWRLGCGGAAAGASAERQTSEFAGPALSAARRPASRGVALAAGTHRTADGAAGRRGPRAPGTRAVGCQWAVSPSSKPATHPVWGVRE